MGLEHISPEMEAKLAALTGGEYAALTSRVRPVDEASAAKDRAVATIREYLERPAQYDSPIISVRSNPIANLRSQFVDRADKSDPEETAATDAE